MIQISEVQDFEVLTVNGSTTKYANNQQHLSAKINNQNVTSLKWEVYDPSSVLIPDKDLQVPLPITNFYPVLYSDNFSNNAKEGRYTARCIGKNSTGDFIVYAEESFFVRLSKSLEQKNLSDLNKIKSNPNMHSFGEVGAAYGRSMMLEHKKAVNNTSIGTIGGNRSPTPNPPGTIEHDCTSYVLDVLEKAFTAKGIKSAWDKIFKNAAKNSNGPFLGTELLKSLVKIGGWKAVFWSPDPKNPDDQETEHPYAYNVAKRKGTYYGIPVESSKSIVNYRKTSSKSKENMTSYDKLKKIPLGVIAAKGGKHMTLIINGVVYEVHWDYNATNEDVIEATSLEKWGWNSGVVVIPASDFKASFP